MPTNEILAIGCLFVALAGVISGAVNRSQTKYGIGRQFIRYNALVIGLPIAASLAFLDMLTQAAVAAILGVLGFIFPDAGRDKK